MAGHYSRITQVKPTHSCYVLNLLTLLFPASLASLKTCKPVSLLHICTCWHDFIHLSAVDGALINNIAWVFDCVAMMSAYLGAMIIITPVRGIDLFPRS
jgi:hypothetical protein